jgi:hypothetical protein
VGFACSLADRADPSSLFSRPESPSAPRGAGDGLGSPDGLRAYSGRKRGTGDAAGPNNAVWIKKTPIGGLVGETAGDALIDVHCLCASVASSLSNKDITSITNRVEALESKNDDYDESVM